MAVDLKNLEGEPHEVAAAALSEARAACDAYIDALREAQRYVCNAAKTEILLADEALEPEALAAAWAATKEARILQFLREKIESHRAALLTVQEIAHNYEGYVE